MFDDVVFTMPYHPELIDYWVPYTGARYKDIHDLILKDGSVLPNYRPNANAWHQSSFPENQARPEGHPGRVIDEDVMFIKLTADANLGMYDFQGAERVKHNVHLFSGMIPNTAMFKVNDYQVIKAITFEGFTAMNARESVSITKVDGVYQCEDRANQSATVKTILDILNMNNKFVWPYDNEARNTQEE